MTAKEKSKEVLDKALSGVVNPIVDVLDVDGVAQRIDVNELVQVRVVEKHIACAETLLLCSFPSGIDGSAPNPCYSCGSLGKSFKRESVLFTFVP